MSIASSSIQPYNITLGEQSPTFQYTPVRDGPVSEGWNSSYTESTIWWGNAANLNTGLGTAYRRTELNNAAFSLDFEGKHNLPALCHNQAGYTVTVDGNAVTKTASSTDTACSPFPEAETLVVADGLSYNKHTATLNALITGSNQSLDFYGGVVTLSAGPAGTSVSSPVWVDDAGGKWVYDGHWDEGGDQTSYNNTHSWACDYYSRETASITFSGVSIVQLIGIPAPNTFGYTVQLDNVETVYNSTDFWWAPNQTMFFAGGLDPMQEHTLTLMDYDGNQPYGPPGLNMSGRYCINLDAVILVNATVPQGSSSTTTSIPSTVAASQSNGVSSNVALPFSSGELFGSATSSLGASHSSGLVAPGNTSPSPDGLPAAAIAGIAVGAVAVLVSAVAVVFILRRTRRRASFRPTSGQAVFDDVLHGTTPPSPDPTPYNFPVQPTSAVTVNVPVSLAECPTVLFADTRRKGIRRSHGPFSAVPTTPSPRVHEGPMSNPSPPTMEGDLLHSAATVDLVTILNERLRREQADNVDEPPEYD